MSWLQIVGLGYVIVAFGLLIVLATDDDLVEAWDRHASDGWIAVLVVAALWPGLLAAGGWRRWLRGRARR